MTRLGKVQELVLRTTVRNGVRVVKTGRVEDIGKSLEESETMWDRGWIGREWLRKNVYSRRDDEVIKESNRVSVSRAVHRLVERGILDAKFHATGVIEDGGMRLHSYGEPTITDKDQGLNGSPTYSFVRVSNKGKKLVWSLSSGEDNDWEDEVWGDQVI